MDAPSRQRRRWLAVLVLLGLGWLASPGGVPLYDGVGFPDEPYRFVPPQGTVPAATVAEVRLKTSDGVNTSGLLANSSEVGPQVSVYAPPQAFALPDRAGSAEIVLRAEAVPPAGELPEGEQESNVYALTLTSAAGEVSVRPEAQSPGITLRAVTVEEPLPTMHHRPDRESPWRALKTRRVGRDNFNAPAPGPGEYVLVRLPAPADDGGTGLLLVVGFAVAIMLAVVVGVRVAARRAAPAEPS